MKDKEDKEFKKWYLKRILDKVFLILEFIWVLIMANLVILDFKAFMTMFTITIIFIIFIAAIELIQIIIEKYKKRSNKK